MPLAAYLRWDALWGLDADGGVPLSRWQDRHLVQELIYACEQVTSVLGFVRYIVEYLDQQEDEIIRRTRLCGTDAGSVGF